MKKIVFGVITVMLLALAGCANTRTVAGDAGYDKVSSAEELKGLSEKTSRIEHVVEQYGNCGEAFQKKKIFSVLPDADDNRTFSPSEYAALKAAPHSSGALLLRRADTDSWDRSPAHIGSGMVYGYDTVSDKILYIHSMGTISLLRKFLRNGGCKLTKTIGG